MFNINHDLGINAIKQDILDAFTNFCSAILLNALKNYLEKGTIIPFEKRN